jgi:hypothetical protein
MVPGNQRRLDALVTSLHSTSWGTGRGPATTVSQAQTPSLVALIAVAIVDARTQEKGDGIGAVPTTVRMGGTNNWSVSPDSNIDIQVGAMPVKPNARK